MLELRLWAVGLLLGSESVDAMLSRFIFADQIFVCRDLGWRWIEWVISIITFGACVLIFFFYPETTGHTLEEMAVVFDGDKAPVIAESTLKVEKLGETKHQESV